MFHGLDTSLDRLLDRRHLPERHHADLNGNYEAFFLILNGNFFRQTTEEPFEPFLIERVTEPVVFVPVTALRTTDEPVPTELTTEEITQLVTEKDSGNDGPKLAQDCYDYFFYDDDSTEPMSTEECLSHLP